MEVYCPYNIANRVFREQDIHKILHKHGLPHYQVSNPRVFQTAMVHTTYVRRSEYTSPDGQTAQLAPCPPGVMPLQDESYECLEFEGDSVLGVCVATYLERLVARPRLAEHRLSNCRSFLSMRDHSDYVPCIAMYIGFCIRYYHVLFLLELFVFVL